MGLVVSLILITIGAILTFAVTGDAEGINLDAVGVILMIVGLVSLLLSLLFWRSWWGPGMFTRATYVEEAGPPASRPGYGGGWWGSRRRTTYVEDDGPPAGPPY